MYVFINAGKKKKTQLLGLSSTIITARRVERSGFSPEALEEMKRIRSAFPQPASSSSRQAERIQKLLQRHKTRAEFLLFDSLCTVMVTSLIFIDIFPFFFGRALPPPSRAQRSENGMLSKCDSPCEAGICELFGKCLSNTKRECYAESCSSTIHSTTAKG